MKNIFAVLLVVSMTVLFGCGGGGGSNDAAVTPPVSSATWKQVYAWSYGAVVQAIAVDPMNSQFLYVGISGGGVYKSTNGGTSWVASNTGLPDVFVRAIYINPANSSTLYVLMEDSAGTGLGAYKSVDSGNSWALAMDSPDFVTPNTAAMVRSATKELVIDSTGQNIYAAVDNSIAGGVYLSTNGGASWTKKNVFPITMAVSSLTIDSANSQILYAGTDAGAFKSVNGGADWTALANGMTSTTNVKAIAIAPSNSQILYALTNVVNLSTGLTTTPMLKSTDGGTTWTSASDGLATLNITSFAIDPANPQVIYAAVRDFTATTTVNSEGIMISTDGGKNWSLSNNGLLLTHGSDTIISSVIIDPTSQKVFLGNASGGLYKKQ